MDTIIQVRFDYGRLDPAVRSVVQEHTEEIRRRVVQTGQNLIEIGKRLIDVKDRLDHGEWGDWLRSEFSWSERSAQNMMRVAETIKYETVADFQNVAPSALYLLAEPSTPPEVRETCLKEAKAGKRMTKAEVRRRIGDAAEKRAGKSPHAEAEHEKGPKPPTTGPKVSAGEQSRDKWSKGRYKWCLRAMEDAWKAVNRISGDLPRGPTAAKLLGAAKDLTEGLRKFLIELPERCPAGGAQ